MIDRARSFYLECLRICAAMYVFMYHVGSETINNHLYLSSPSFNSTLHLNYYGAHFFVVVFFVLSGFLIAMSASRPNLAFTDFLSARLGRLYSVMLPALILSYLVSFILSKSGLISSIENDDHLFSRFLLNISFLTQAWHLCATPPMDGPMWSIGYEFVYYMMLASLVFYKGSKRVFIFLFICFVIGLKVLLLFPCWIGGSALYYLLKQKRRYSVLLSFSIFILSSILIVYSLLNPEHFPFIKPTNDDVLLGMKLFYSWNFLSDYLFCLLVLANIFGFFGISGKLSKLKLFTTENKFLLFITKIGNCTYTLYLFHVPLMIFIASLIGYDRSNPLYPLLLIVVTLVLVFFIARQTEWKVLWWRDVMKKIIHFFVKKLPLKLLS